MRVSTEGYCAIASFEGVRLKAYKCPAGVWTIGYGHTEGVKEGDTINYAEAGKLLRCDIEKCEVVLDELGKLTQGQIDAIVSFVFNVGKKNWDKSTLKKIIKSDRFSKQIGKEFMRWVYSKGKRLNGLVRRREWEARRYYE